VVALVVAPAVERVLHAGRARDHGLAIASAAARPGRGHRRDRRARSPRRAAATAPPAPYSDETEARIAPFDTVPLNVADWWPPSPG
jgi:hypothetical protein